MLLMLVCFKSLQVPRALYFLYYPFMSLSQNSICMHRMWWLDLKLVTENIKALKTMSPYKKNIELISWVQTDNICFWLRGFS